MELVFLAMVFVALIPVVLYFILKPMIKEQKISSGIRNQDMFSQNYLFMIKHSKQDFLKQIEIPNITDTMEYTFDDSTMTITFSKYGTHVPYTVIVKELENGCYIQLTKNALVVDGCRISYYINEFMINKFDAELLPYDEYKNIVT